MPAVVTKVKKQTKYVNQVRYLRQVIWSADQLLQQQNYALLTYGWTTRVRILKGELTKRKSEHSIV